MTKCVGFLHSYITILAISIASGEISVTTDYESVYRDGNTYYILNGDSVTLVCEHGLTEEQVYDVIWYNSQENSELLLFKKAVLPGNEVKGTPLEDRDVAWTYTDTSHKLTIPQVNILTDAIRYRCVVENQLGNTGEAHLDLNNKIYDAPDSVSLSTIDFVVEDSPTDIQCTVSSIYPGSEETELRIKVGSQYHTGGTESQSQDTNGVTYTVTYTQSLRFNRNQQGQEVQCEVTWGEGPIEVTKTSNTEELDVYYVPSSVNRTSVSPSSQVTENTLLTLSCEVDSYPASRLRLYRLGTTAPVKSVNDANNLEYKVTVDKDDNGAQFYCRADDNNKHTGWEFDVESEKLRINVLYSAISVTISGNTDPNPNLGEQREMMCTTDANPEPVITLYRRDGTDTVHVGNSARNSLSETITMTREINRDLFYCTATSSNTELLSYSKDSDTKYYTILFSASRVSMTQSPSGPVSENTEVTFTCVTNEAEPTADVLWSVDGNTRSSGSDSAEEGMYNTQKRRSVLTVRVDRTLNKKKVECHVIGNTETTDSVILDVRYPPEVSVQTASNTIEEDSQLNVACDVEAGNPEHLTSLYWEFEPKYPGTQTQALPGQRENRELGIENTVYSDAGTYRCTAGNTVGSNTGEIQIAVHYPPQLIRNDLLIFYSGLDQQISLNITVRAFPEFSDLDSAFTWTTSSRSQITDGVTSTKQSNEIFYSELLIGSVKGEDYTSYTVTADNGVKEPVIFTVDLLQRGPPEAPRDVTVVAVAAERANITWIVGLSGGYPQTFRVLIKEKDKTVDQKFYDTGHQNPENGSLEYFIIPDLLPETEYEIFVRSRNEYNGGSHTDSNTTTLISRAKPIVNAEDLTVEYRDSIAILTWKYEVTDPEITRVVIEQCILGGACTVYNVTENTQKTLEVPASNGEIFYLVIYQDGLEAYRSERFAVVTPPPDDDKTAPVVVSVVVVIVLIGTIVLVLLYRKYRHKFKRNRKYEAEDGQSPPEHLYINEAFHTSNYMELDRNDMNIKPTEYQVVNTGAGVTSNEIGIYEDIRKSRQLKMHCDKDLSLGDLIKKGRYSLLHKGFLQMKGQQIAVMVKSINEEIRVSEAQYIFNQVSCLEQIPSHPGIIELFSFGITAPLNVKVVTRYCTNGDLRNFLQQEFKMDNFQCIQDKETFLKQLILEILQGLSYLENQSLEILHYQLSSEHVLVDEKKSCRLTGFGFREHVLQREIREEDEGIYGAIQWKAPEVIEDCKAHSKASDIWSFGILLHEIFSLGSIPYDGMIEEDIKAFVKEGNTLEKISSCPINVYQMMRKCWAYNPEKRPSFTSMLRNCQIPKKPDLGGIKKQESPTYEDVSTKQHFPEKIHYENVRA